MLQALHWAKWRKRRLLGENAERQRSVDRMSTTEDDRNYHYFRYEPLRRPNEIRLVKLYPKGARTSISIVHKRLDEPPGYSAVSYMWGSRGPRQNIDVVVNRSDHAPASSQHTSSQRSSRSEHSRCVFRVSWSLKLMLEDLRDAKDVRYLWIDAICINQADIRERSSQVALMGDIYSHANYVVAYLNDSIYDHELRRLVCDNELAAAARSIKESTQRSSVLRSYDYDSDYDRDRDRDRRLRRDRGRDYDSTEESSREVSYDRLLNHPYFNRRWVIQEICLARYVTVHCSGSQFPMGELMQLVGGKSPRRSRARNSRSRSVSTYDSYSHKNSHESATYSTDSRAASICRLRRQIASSKSKLVDLLIEHASAECSDFRDKVYALLSLTQEAKGNLPIDYTIRPLDLVLSVLYVSLTQEQLTSSRLLSSACFLMRNFQISYDDLRHDMRQDTFGIVPRGTKFRPRIVVRGIISTSYVDSHAEITLHKYHDILTPILQRPPIELIEIESPTPIEPHENEPAPHGESHEGEPPAPNGYKLPPLNEYQPPPLNEYQPPPLNEYRPYPLNEYQPYPLNEYQTPNPDNYGLPRPVPDTAPRELPMLVPRQIKSSAGQSIGPLQQSPFAFGQLLREEPRSRSYSRLAPPGYTPPPGPSTNGYEGQSSSRADHAGQSSVGTKIDDEIWQFPGTPVAFVARKSEFGYTLVGRALIFEAQRSHYSGSSFNWRCIEVTVPELLELTAWADLDNGVDDEIHDHLSTLNRAQKSSSRGSASVVYV